MTSSTSMPQVVTSPMFASGIEWTRTLLALAAIGVLLLLGGIWIGYRTARSRTRTPAPMPAPAPAPRLDPPRTDGSPATDGHVNAQRTRLITGFLTLREMLDDQVSTGVIDETLIASGVERVDPTGYPLNPARHRVVGTEPAPEKAADGVIARTTAPGFADSGRMLKPARVVVYKWDRT